MAAEPVHASNNIAVVRSDDNPAAHLPPPAVPILQHQQRQRQQAHAITGQWSYFIPLIYLATLSLTYQSILTISYGTPYIPSGKRFRTERPNEGKMLIAMLTLIYLFLWVSGVTAISQMLERVDRGLQRKALGISVGCANLALVWLLMWRRETHWWWYLTGWVWAVQLGLAGVVRCKIMNDRWR